MSVSLCKLNYSYLTSGKTCWLYSFRFLSISHSLLVINSNANFYLENSSWLVRLYRKNEDLPSVSTQEYIKVIYLFSNFNKIL